MSTAEINLLTRQANAMAEGSGVTCSYEWTSSRGGFKWVFRRRGVYLGRTSVKESVLVRMAKYVKCGEE